MADRCVIVAVACIVPVSYPCLRARYPFSEPCVKINSSVVRGMGLDAYAVRLYPAAGAGTGYMFGRQQGPFSNIPWWYVLLSQYLINHATVMEYVCDKISYLYFSLWHYTQFDLEIAINWFMVSCYRNCFLGGAAQFIKESFRTSTGAYSALQLPRSWCQGTSPSISTVLNIHCIGLLACIVILSMENNIRKYTALNKLLGG